MNSMFENNQNLSQTKNPKKVLGKILIGFLVFIIIFFGASFFYVQNQLFSRISKDSAEKVFEIKEGQKVTEIVDSLRQENLIKNNWLALLYLKIKKTDKNLKSGIYLVKQNLTSAGVLDFLASGKTSLKKITILEGWTIEETADYLDSRSIVKKNDFLEEVKIEKWNFSFLEGSETLEGFLFPDTYYISYKADSKEIIEKMLKNFDKKFTPLMRDEIKKQGKSIKEVITLASIVEKEVSKDSDRKIVAGLFLKRTSLGMPLESDATINYITKKDKAQPSFEETRTNSPYNTYLNKGFPPGPICNPSLSSIMAAIYPEESPYLYYLNRQDTKETIFSKTYDEHLANKRKYLK